MENSTEKQVFWVNVLVKDPALPGERFDGGLRMEIHMWPLLEVNDVRSQVEAGCLVATHCFYVNENLLPVFWDRLVTKSWGADLQALETYTVTNLQLQGLLSEKLLSLAASKAGADTRGSKYARMVQQASGGVELCAQGRSRRTPQ